MIGQYGLKTEITRQVEELTFPRFSLIIGEFGSEKNQVAEYVADQLNATCISVPDCRVDTIREVISSAYTVKSLTVYNITDADSMSTQARNALLKVTEEPPNKAYFIMTLEDENNTLPTIKSRGTVYRMEPYSMDDLIDYVSQFTTDSRDIEAVLSVCETPGEIDLMLSYKPVEFISFVEKVVENVATVSGSNAFKIVQSIQFKDTDEKGYNLRLFWKTFCNVCMEHNYHNGVALASRYLSMLSVKTINKSMLFDMWLLDIRKEWKDGSN